MNPQVTAWKVTFDNSGALTVFAETQAEAMKKAEDKAQEHGWNLRATQAEQLNRKLQAAGRRGGRATGPTKARPLSPDRARQMARARWAKCGVSVKPVDRVTQEGP